MRIGVIGAGAVGGVLAALLDRAGHSVAVTARGAHLAAIQDLGITLSGAWGSHVARVDATPELPTGVDLVLVTTKAQDAAAALGAHAHLDGVPVLVIQNGLEAISTATRLLPHSPVAGGLALFAASFLSPGVVSVTAAQPLYLGGAVAPFVDLLSPLLPVTVVSNFAGAQWTKLIVNQLNALPAITGLSVQETIAHPGLRRVLTASMREAVRVGIAAGVRFESLQGLTDASLRRFARQPLWAAQALPLRFARTFGDVPNPGSTLQSLRRGQRTEIDYLNGAVVAAGSAPINAALVALVHSVEKSGVFLAPAEVVQQLSAKMRRGWS
ncbi:2-dehydropantoate 2-reductase [Glaciihabitans arcticus]|uniref:2-dehydropantoate 2-reductase n=1 Tax=Glaciihabitans arcticus TaxID=2668039 RepID=A0A4Q9GNJ9_9MICO|nr:2-dehydropantoate 2-reductase [Glaciihabitans arcticus]TBN56372.1 2-dehydropantoate 2-reductase [Glaciihabitans arcticus]